MNRMSSAQSKFERKITDKLTGHPAISVVLYYLVVASMLRIMFECTDAILIRWAVAGLFGGLISFMTILYIVITLAAFYVAVSSVCIYLGTETPKYLNMKHPKLSKWWDKIFYILTVIDIICIVIRVILSIHQVYVSHEIDGYAADLPAAVYYNLTTLVYGLVVFTMFRIIFCYEDYK